MGELDLSEVARRLVGGPVAAVLTPTEIPGLFDVELSDGRQLRDLTMAQVQYLAARERWLVRTQR